MIMEPYYGLSFKASESTRSDKRHVKETSSFTEIENTQIKHHFYEKKFSFLLCELCSI